MSKMKKLLAMLLALAMVLGMSLTTFAAEGLNIPVSNASDATFQHAQLIRLNPEKETGWEFVSEAVAQKYIDVLTLQNVENFDDQDAIWMLIKKMSGQTPVTGMPNYISSTSGASDGQVAQILRNIKNAAPAIITLEPGKTVTAPGVYFLDATEVGYVYNAMAAYVSFGPYTDGVPSGLECDGIQAKKADTDIQKTNNNGDAVTEIGRVVEYTITTTVPYIAKDNNADYIITDTISGAVYENVSEGKVAVTVTVGNGEATTMYATLNGANSWSLELTSIATESNANKELVIKYSAKVTDMVVHNNVVTNDGDHGDSTDNFLFAGTATITKVDEANEKVKLDDAEFVVKKGEMYATFTAITEEVKGETVTTGYKLSGWVSDIDDATPIITGTYAKGQAKVYGLDNSELYQFVETKAPNGYSLNETPENIAWSNPVETDKTTTVGKVTVNYKEVSVTGSATMKDTTLVSLPSTGGIGTTIFTVAGCGIMIAAAYLFFNSRRREEA